MVEILSVTLKNFKAHGDRCFTFQPGTNAISGENGAGKTSILEAIAWVLFDHRGEYKVEDFIRNGEKSAQATVQFVSSRDHRTYEVQRNTRSGYAIYDPQLNEKLNLTRIKEEVLPWLRQNLGVAPGVDLSELFASTIGVPQGTFTADFQLTPEKRKAIFDKILKVEEYQKTYKDLINLEKYAKSLTESRSRELEQYDEQLQEWDSLVAAQTTLQQEIAQSETALTQWQAQLTTLKAEQERLGAQAAELQTVTQQWTQLSSQVTAQETALARLKVELAQCEAAVAICTDRRSAYQAVLQAEATLKELEQQRQQQQHIEQQKQQLIQQSADRTAQLATLNHQIERCQAAQQDFDRLIPQVKQQQDLEKQIQQTQQQLQQLQSSEIDIMIFSSSDQMHLSHALSFTVAAIFSPPFCAQTPMKTTPLSAYFFINSLVWGTAARQGPHHVAQKSSTTILPLRSAIVSGLELIQSFTSRAGAGLPCMASSVARLRLPST
ncbi:MAG: hypothetical protein RLZZ511_3836 [Cyanobacteriota bacterium]